MSSSDEEYYLEPETVYLLELYRNGNDAIQRGEEWDSIAEKGADYVYELSDMKKGAVVIDLLTLFSEFERVVMAEKAKAVLDNLEDK